MYSTKISNSMTVDKKGEARLDSVKVSVDGYSEPRTLEKAKDAYNSGKDIPKTQPYSGWPKGMWYELYCGMMANMIKWKRKRK